MNVARTTLPRTMASARAKEMPLVALTPKSTAPSSCRGEVQENQRRVVDAIALLGSAGDLRVVRSGALKGASRLARHLWRMSTALLIAALSVTVRLPRILPEPLRVPVVLALPMVAVLVTMLYWLWRVRSRRS